MRQDRLGRKERNSRHTYEESPFGIAPLLLSAEQTLLHSFQTTACGRTL
jgi:hypothetical protein